MRSVWRGRRYRSRHTALPEPAPVPVSRHRRSFGLVALAVLVLLVAACAGLAKVEGLRLYVVHTGSMEPTLMPGDVVVDRPLQGRPRTGEIITFRHSDQATDVVTHRVAAVWPGGLIKTKGDANRTADSWQIRPDQVQGRVVLHIPALGYLLVFLRRPSGVATLAMAIIAVTLLWGLFFPSQPEPDSAESDDSDRVETDTPVVAES